VFGVQELRQVLQEHEWNSDDALEVLQMFSENGEQNVFVFVSLTRADASETCI